MNGGGGGSTFPYTGSATITGSLIITGSTASTLGFTGSLQGTSSWAHSASQALSSSYATTASYAMNGGGGTGVSYITASGPFSLTGIEVADFSNDVAVTFINNTLKFVFGAPLIPSAPTLSFNNTFLEDRFNRVTDNYNVSGSFTVNGYTLVSASLYEGSTLLAQTGSGAILRYNTTTSGSHTYRLEVTASSPLDGTFNFQTSSLTGTISKIPPTAPTITPTPLVQLGASNNEIEQGATGSISFTSAYGNSNGYTQVSLVNSPTTSPLFVTGSATGSANIVISSTASYTSPGTDNVPTLTPAVSSSITYSKIRSVRYGASTATSYTQGELENLALWDTTLGGTIGTIIKGTTVPSSAGTFDLVMNGGKYGYIVVDSGYTLTYITNTLVNLNDIDAFTRTVVGPYAVYRTNLEKGSTVPYKLTPP
jgi:hypothetical protein